MDFGEINALPPRAQQLILTGLTFLADVYPEARFELAPGDRRFLPRAMSAYPRESDSPRYDPTKHPDAYLKFLCFGGSEDPIPAPIGIFNKSGLADGTVTDNAYMVEFEHRVEFLLAATLTTNANRTLNDDTCEYDSVALPFLRHLGQAALRSTREHRPDLAGFSRPAGAGSSRPFCDGDPSQPLRPSPEN